MTKYYTSPRGCEFRTLPPRRAHSCQCNHSPKNSEFHYVDEWRQESLRFSRSSTLEHSFQEIAAAPAVQTRPDPQNRAQLA